MNVFVFIKKLKAYFTNTTLSKSHFLLFLALSLLMIIVGNMCNIPGIIDSPQFAKVFDKSVVEDLLGTGVVYWAYKSFFIIDFFWSFLLVLLIWKIVYRFYKVSEPTRFATLSFKVFSVIVVLAWISDNIENVLYLVYYQYHKGIEMLKIGCYVIALVVTFIVILYTYFKSLRPTLLHFFKSSVFSLFILIIIGVFLPKTPQVNSIIVNLYEYPENFLLLFLIAPTYAIVLAHYPSYFDVEKDKRDWYSAFIKVGLFRTIFYKNKTNQPNQKEAYKPIEGYLNFLFRGLGILFFCALFYIIGYTSQVNLDWQVSVSSIGIALFVIGLFLLHRFKHIKNAWLDTNYKYLKAKLPDFYDGDYIPKDEAVTYTEQLNPVPASAPNHADRHTKLIKINKWVSQYLWALGITVLLHIILFFFLFIKIPGVPKYSQTTAVLSLVCIGAQMITYVYYRAFRSVFRFSFFNKHYEAVLNAFYILRPIIVEPKEKRVSDAEIEANRLKILNFFKAHDFIGNNRVFKAFSTLYFGALSNNIVYLHITILMGVINALFLLFINIFDFYALYFNAVLIILSYCFFFYGVIVVVVKNFIYYNYSEETFAITHKTRYNFLLVISCFVLLILNTLSQKFSNELFTLKLIDRKLQQELTLKAYQRNLPKAHSMPRYYIGAYGGGMKANAWTLVVLNKLYKNDKDFFKKAVCISGTSGGTIGLINMAAITKSVKDSTQWGHYIKNIATSNVLGLDITHIFGRDTFNHLLVPSWDLRGYDRSSKAMAVYARLSNNPDQNYTPTPYRTFWKAIYENRNNQFPILISNSTNVSGNQGMAVSVRVNNTYLDTLLYQGANNVLKVIKDDKNYTLSYYDAASTSNRFPIISPAAKIETIGHFNDGGIYENSGLLSAYKLFKTIHQIEHHNQDYSELQQKNVFINIVNDKTLYIKYTVEKYLKDSLNIKTIKVKEVNENSEIFAVLASVASTEMMPIFIKTELQRLANKFPCIAFETIYLPHRFTVADIKAIYGKALNVSDTDLYTCVTQNNADIKTLIESNSKKDSIIGPVPIIEPPISRMIAVGAYDFMERMLEFKTTKTALDNVLKNNDN